MLKIKHISMKNFFSFGNVPQEVDLESSDLALILGHNKDAAVTDGSHGHRNGVGKSAIIQGIVYGLYGKSIDNSIKIPNLVNKINEKYCEVHLTFEKDGKQYKIERGRSPTYFNFYHLDKNGQKTLVNDETRGEKKDTQEELTEILGITQKLFEHIVVLNANVEPFLSLPLQKQRDMIEELLGITQLTEKANLLKDMAKESKRLADQEQFKNNTILESNKRIESTIETLIHEATIFDTTKEANIKQLTEELLSFDGIDFDELRELAQEREAVIKNNEKYNQVKLELELLQSKYLQYDEKINNDKKQIVEDIKVLENIDIESELQAHDELLAWNELYSILTNNKNQYMMIQRDIKSNQSNVSMLQESLKVENIQLEEIKNSRCPTCKSVLEHNDHNIELTNSIKSKIQSIESDIQKYTDKIEQLTSQLNEIELFELPPKPTTLYSSLSDAKLHEHKLNELKKQLDIIPVNIYHDELNNKLEVFNTLSLLDVPDTLSLEDVNMLEYQKKTVITNFERENSTLNPYTSQIEVLKRDSIQQVHYDDYNYYSKLTNHQDFLSKLLLSKDSFVRKRVIEQNLSFLNSRLSYYIAKTGSLHNVIFMNDLSVEIALNLQSYDFKQLSRGERTRIIIALNLAFRDTYEALYQSINIMFVDELFDQGLDTTGIIDSWKILQDMSTTQHKNIYVVSHRDELIEKADTIVKVVKEHNFSTIEFTNSDDLSFQ